MAKSLLLPASSLLPVTAHLRSSQPLDDTPSCSYTSTPSFKAKYSQNRGSVSNMRSVTLGSGRRSKTLQASSSPEIIILSKVRLGKNILFPLLFRGNVVCNPFVIVGECATRAQHLCDNLRTKPRPIGRDCAGRVQFYHLGLYGKRRVYGAQATMQEKDDLGVVEQKSAAMEALELLEWPRVCRAVASFAATTLGKEQLQVVEMPATKEASEALLAHTSAGVELISLLGGPFEFGSLQTQAVKNFVVRACKGVVISGQEALSVALLLQMGQSVRRSITTTVQEFQNSQSVLFPLLDMVSPLVTHPELVKAIWHMVDEDGSVKDNASPELRRARIQQRSLEQRLQELMNKLTWEKDGSSSQDVVTINGRMCMAVASDNHSQVAGLLLRSGSGATAYVEPAAAVPLNNKLAEARADVLKAEYDVLSNLTKQLRPYLDDIQFCLDIITHLDVVMARARYSSWLGATKPSFIDSDSQNLITLQLQRARHPLLVQQHREVLREARAKLKSRSKNQSRLRARAGTTMAALEDMEASCAEVEAEVADVEANAPVPIDVRVSSTTKVVAITGPNTGGKTATIKTVGLAALMAKAGLYVLAIEPVWIPWFDAVLADIGDEQSLSQSLSTFSGHLQRIKRIKGESTGNSLVLLDEVGAGTDPTEGAALGMALLESFAHCGQGGSLLTMATTHHGELKTLKYSDSRFENASVEFSEEKLRPTYKLLWGIPGRSNALNIAERLGLPKDILTVARGLHGVASAQLSEVIMELEEARRDHDHDLALSESRLAEAKRYYNDLGAASVRLQEHKRILELEKGDHVAAAASAARSQLHALARNVKGVTSSLPLSPKSTIPSSATQPSKDHNASKMGSRRDGDFAGAKGGVPCVGDVVYVPKLRLSAKVIELPHSGRKDIILQSGFMQVKVKLEEIQWPGLIQA